VENLDLASAARHMRRRELSFRGWLGSLRGIDERAWLAWDDLRPFLAMCCSLVCASFRRVLRLDRGRVSRARNPARPGSGHARKLLTRVPCGA